MSIENTTTIAGLRDTNPETTDPVYEGPNHFWVLKRVLKGIFPGRAGQGFAQPITAFEDDLNSLRGMADDAATRQKTMVEIVRDFQRQIDDLVSKVGAGTGSTGTIQQAYPVGSIFLSFLEEPIPDQAGKVRAVIPTDNRLLGYGTWTRIAHGRALFGVEEGGIFDRFDSQGGSRHAIVPQHSHVVVASSGAPDNNASGFILKSTAIQMGNSGSYTVETSTPAGSAPITNANLPPYIAVYVWKRVA